MMKRVVEALESGPPGVQLVLQGFQDLWMIALRDDHGHETVCIVRACDREQAKAFARAWAAGHGTTWRIVSSMPI